MHTIVGVMPLSLFLFFLYYLFLFFCLFFFVFVLFLYLFFVSVSVSVSLVLVLGSVFWVLGFVSVSGSFLKYVIFSYYKLLMTELSRNLWNIFRTQNTSTFWQLRLDNLPSDKVFQIFLRKYCKFSYGINWLWKFY